jgi:hypothetical protein
MHIDNAFTHNSWMTRDFVGHHPLKRLQHPPYSPDISPSDFYLFGNVKSALIDQEIPDEINIHEAVTEIGNDVSNAELQRVFQSWIERVERVFDAGGDYLTSSIFSSSLSYSVDSFMT